MAGLRHTRPAVVLRELSCRVGDVIDWNRLDRDRLRLLDLAIFADVSMGAARDTLTGEPVLRVRVRERPVFLAYPVFEYSREDGFSYGAYGYHIDFRGMNEALGLLLLTGGRSDASVWYQTPWLFGHRFGAGVEFHDSHRTNLVQDLNERHTGGSFSLDPTSGPRTSFPFQFGAERVRVRARATDARTRWQSHRWMQQGFWHDGRDYRYRPREGGVIGLSAAAHGGAFGGDANFERYQLDCLRVLPVGRQGAFTAASRLIWSRGTVPDYLRLSLGGTTSLRGYAEGEFEGESRWDGWCEERFPLIPRRSFSLLRGRYTVDWTLDGAVFVDGGSIWEGRALEKGRAQARWSAGAGLRLVVPLARLLSLDVASDGRHVRLSGMTALRL